MFNLRSQPQQQASRQLRPRDTGAGSNLRNKKLLLAVSRFVGFGILCILFNSFSVDDEFGFLVNLDTTTTNNNNKVVAYAITLTNCSQETLQQHYSVDAAAVLKHSIHLSSCQTPTSQSNYDYQMYAFVHEDVRSKCAPIAKALQRLNYKVHWLPTPFSLDDITNPKLREKIHKQGCCEEKELLKLYTLQLTDHPVAVHLDLDTLVLKKLDHLYDAMLDTDDSPQHATTSASASRELVHQHMQPHSPDNDVSKETLPPVIHSYFTRDYNMARPGLKPNRTGMQGGFWIVRPSQTTFADIVSLITDHSNHYDKCGWGGCAIGSAHFYGGAGFQGIISYYYSFYRNGDFSNNKDNGPHKKDVLPPDPPQYVELNRCLYNSMADKARKACYSKLHGEPSVCDHCNNTDLTELYGAHFTLCQKPWICWPFLDQQLCYRFHHAWHAIRENYILQKQQQQQQVSTTTPFQLDDPEPDHRQRKKYFARLLKRFPNQCKSKGVEGYVPMNLLRWNS